MPLQNATERLLLDIAAMNGYHQVVYTFEMLLRDATEKLRDATDKLLPRTAQKWIVDLLCRILGTLLQGVMQKLLLLFNTAGVGVVGMPRETVSVGTIAIAGTTARNIPPGGMKNLPLHTIVESRYKNMACCPKKLCTYREIHLSNNL